MLARCRMVSLLVLGSLVALCSLQFSLTGSFAKILPYYPLHHGSSRSQGRPPVVVESSVQQSTARESAQAYDDTRKLGVFFDILVVSRPSRLDRRATMEQLRLALGVSWTYIDAVSYDDPIVHSIMDCVRSVRSSTRSRRFSWPEDWNPDTPWQYLSVTSLKSSCYLLLSGTPSRMMSSSQISSTAILTGRHLSERVLPRAMTAPTSYSAELLTCAKGNRVQGVSFKQSLPSYMLLTPAKVACWQSHLAAIRRIAEYRDSRDLLASDAARAFLVLEDDVDMEMSISKTLRVIWDRLPTEWDIIFLGEYLWRRTSPSIPP
ncbi:hypothetical protein BD414DRAFT_490493 [Trametes punicea]|nr:hypothetical protein BD414DRAFT_490493 [Trametes punicea]